MTAYYNEIDPYAAQWVRNLSAANRIAPGVVDNRSIKDVRPDDVSMAVQAHFFAGIAIWSLALRMAGWPDDKPVWSGSCPCQSFSSAGKGLGFNDPRHLWPEWFRLIRECRPEFILGEQVQSTDGGAWLDLVHADLESVGYAVGAVVLPAASVGAPHIRHRIFFGARRLADSNSRGCSSNRLVGRLGEVSATSTMERRAATQSNSHSERLADSRSERCVEHGERDGDPTRPGEQAPHRDDAGRRYEDGPAQPGGLGNPCGAGLAERPLPAHQRGTLRLEGAALGETGPLRPWRDLEWLDCSDGKRRPTQPGLFPLAPGHPGRVAQLRAAGNAISPQVAAVFVTAFMESL